MRRKTFQTVISGRWLFLSSSRWLLRASGPTMFTQPTNKANSLTKTRCTPTLPVVPWPSQSRSSSFAGCFFASCGLVTRSMWFLRLTMLLQKFVPRTLPFLASSLTSCSSFAERRRKPRLSKAAKKRHQEKRSTSSLTPSSEFKQISTVKSYLIIGA